MNQSTRFFVSFSSADLIYVREIMTALKGQELDVWDYSDMVESIELGDVIAERLIKEIDQCTHMIVVLSINSLDVTKGRFCRMEIQYAFEKRLTNNLTILPVVIGDRTSLSSDAIYQKFEESFSQDFTLTPESIVALTVKICQVIGKPYIPPIVAHPKLPFRELFRKEVAEMAEIAKMSDEEKKVHSVKSHTDLMIILGEFNEYYKKDKEGLHHALFLITYFLMSWEYKKIRYSPFYPWIVKAVCETELKLYYDAMKSYETARAIHPDNQDVIGGMGTVYFETQEYQKATECFEQIIRNNKSEVVTNARINLIITKQSMGVMIGIDEECFLFSVYIEEYPDDLKTKILNAQGIQYRIKKDYVALEKHCKYVISKNLHDTVTNLLLQLSYINRGIKDSDNN
jgi:tetratricopeptide (TPR) repeat protein